MTSIAYSHFTQAAQKSYLITKLSLEIKLRSYTWFKVGTRDIPRYYLRDYHDRDLSNIDSTAKVWTKFLNLIPLIPNSLAINSKTGEEYKFVLFGRNAWEVKINENIS